VSGEETFHLMIVRAEKTDDVLVRSVVAAVIDLGVFIRNMIHLPFEGCV